MDHLRAVELVEYLKRRSNLLRVDHGGHTQVWFSSSVPAGLPLRERAESLGSELVIIPAQIYYTPTRRLTGGMMYWQHTGPRIIEAAAYISIRPLQSEKPFAEFASRASAEGHSTQASTGLWAYGFAAEKYKEYFREGMLEGISEPAEGYPLADVRIEILAALSHPVGSSPHAFQVLGQWLIEALISEMYQGNLLEAKHLPHPGPSPY